VDSANRRNRLSATFAAVIVIIFSAFIGMFTFGRDAFAETAVPGVPWSAIVEPLLIVVALVISVAYAVVMSRMERAGGRAR
jgi:uncharacterized membrane protein (DUF485 family)